MDGPDRNLILKLSELILKQVKVYGRPEEYESHSKLSDEEVIKFQIDIIGRTLEILRIHYRHLDNWFPLEEFIQGHLDINDQGLHFRYPEKFRALGSGTAPISLQPKLLLFLLYRLNYSNRILDIIDYFIRTIWDELSLIDFKRTETGVLRCYTNTRFAARKLREYGLLKDTKEEMFKTWKLSLPGVIVAAQIMDQKWTIPPVNNPYKFDLHPDICFAFDELKNYSIFVHRLASICNPSINVFKKYEEGSKRAYTKLTDYWAILKDSSLSNKEKKRKSLACLKRLEQDPEVKVFYEEFMFRVHIGDMLNTRVT